MVSTMTIWCVIVVVRSFDFHNSDMQGVQQDILQDHGFTVTNHRLILYGVCTDCSQTSAHKD